MTQTDAPRVRKPKRYASLVGECLELKPFNVERGGETYQRVRLSLQPELPGVRGQYPEVVFLRADRIGDGVGPGRRVNVTVAYGNNADATKRPYIDGVSVQAA